MPAVPHRALSEESPEGICLVRDGAITYANRRLTELTGYPTDQLVGKPLSMWIDESDRSRVEAQQQACRTGEPSTDSMTVTLRTRTDTCRSVQLSMRQVESDGASAVAVYTRPIPPQRAAVDTERSSADKAVDIFDTIQQDLFLLDVTDEEEVRFERINEQKQQTINRSNREVRGCTPTSVFGTEIGERLTARCRECIERREHVEYEETEQTDDESTVWRISLTPIVVEERVEWILGAAHEITELQHTKQELESLRERFKLAVQAARLGVWDWDVTTDEVIYNDHWAEMLGYEPAEIESRLEAWESRVHPDDRDRVKAALEEHMAGETDYYETEHRLRTADGEWKWVRDVGTVIAWTADGAPRRAIGIHIDIDQQKRRERELKRRSLFLEHSFDQTLLLDASGRVQYQSGHSAEAYPVSFPQLRGENPLSYIHPDDVDVVGHQLETLLDSPGHTDTATFRVQASNGEWRWVEARAHNFLNKPMIAGVLVTVRDVTQRKQYERRLESQRDDLQILNQIVRHDIRNHLQLVIAYADQLADRMEDSGDQIQALLNAAYAATSLTRSAREVTEAMLQSDAELESVAIRPVLETQVENIQARYDNAVVRFDGTVPNVTVRADGMLGSVFRNLITNAIQHNDKELPRVTLSVRPTAEMVRISVKDNGPGIPEAERERLFAEGAQGLDSEGTGLGLYLVKMLVDRYRGEVTVDNREPEGAIFTVEVPRS